VLNVKTTWTILDFLKSTEVNFKGAFEYQKETVFVWAVLVFETKKRLALNKYEVNT